jgi:hypothetical protein
LICTSRRLIRRKRTVTYHGQYFTINSRISECDHKCETRNAEPEIGTDGSSQTRRNPRVDGYGSGFGPPRVCGSGFWPVLEPNRPGFAVQTQTAGALPGLVANTSRVCHSVLLGDSVGDAAIRHLYPSRVRQISEMLGFITRCTASGVLNLSIDLNSLTLATSN